MSALHLFENHDEAYHIWQRQGLAGMTLVHLDAHHDMYWLSSRSDLHIGNYICQAIKEGVVTSVWWIVPDPTWSSASSRKQLRRIVKRLTKSYPGTGVHVRAGADRLTTELLGVPVTIGPLACLPHHLSGVLLDIDTDFMLIPIVSAVVSDTGVDGPWIWPEDVASRLRTAGVVPAVTTIAYSVEGGYTPLQWKYLGDALAAELGTLSAATAPLRAGFSSLREAAAAAGRGDLAMAETLGSRARTQLPHDAAPVYNLARWLASARRLPEARALYGAARDLDLSYATPFNNRGPWYLSRHRPAAAEREFALALELNPADSYARLGLAQVAALRKRWRDAETMLRVVLAADPDIIDAARLLGDVLTALKRDDEAAAAYRHSLRLALSGIMPLRQATASAASMTGPRDFAHGKIHARLARLDERHGRLAEAAAGYRMGIAARDRVSLRVSLARTYAKQGRWARAARETMAALCCVPADARAAMRKCRSAIRNRAPLTA